MPVPIPVPNFAILGVYFEGRMFGQQTITSLHLKLNKTGGLPDAQAEALDVIAQMRQVNGIFQRYLECLTIEVNRINIYAQWIYPQRLRYVTDGLPDEAGVIAPPSCPQNVAQVITRGSDLAGRKGIGNLHLPGVPADEVQAGILSPLQVSRLNTLANLLDGMLATPNAEYYHVLYRRSNPPLGEAVDIAFAQDTSRVMRRRTVGVGS